MHGPMNVKKIAEMFDSMKQFLHACNFNNTSLMLLRNWLVQRPNYLTFMFSHIYSSPVVYVLPFLFCLIVILHFIPTSLTPFYFSSLQNLPVFLFSTALFESRFGDNT
jgi:hypothetical protein